MSKIVAKVGTITITDDEVTEYLMSMGQRGQSYNSPEGRKAILERIIAGKLMLLDAKRNLLEVEPAFKAQLLAELVERVWPKIEDGTIKPSVYRVLPIEQATEAHALLREGKSAGKVVMTFKE